MLVLRRRARWILGLPAAMVVALVATSVSAGACNVSTSVSLSPTSGPPGTTVLVSGGGFDPPPGGAVDVSLGIGGPVLASTDVSTFSIPVTIPSNARGIIVIAATDHAGDVAYVTATFSVSAPSSTPAGAGSSSTPSNPAPSGSSSTDPGSGGPVSSTAPQTGSGSASGSTVSGPAPANAAAASRSASNLGAADSDATVAPADGSPLGGAGALAGTPESAGRAAGPATVYGNPGNGFSASAGVGSFHAATPRPVPGVAPGLAVILFATLLPLPVLVGGVLAARRRKAHARH